MLEEREISAGIEPVSAWLRHLVTRTPDLETASTKRPRAATLQRLADMAAALNNDPLARQLDAAARRVSARISAPSRTVDLSRKQSGGKSARKTPRRRLV